MRPNGNYNKVIVDQMGLAYVVLDNQILDHLLVDQMDINLIDIS